MIVRTTDTGQISFTDTEKADILEWDVHNWWKFIEEIEASNIGFSGAKALELGGRNGGLSLYYALKGANVICSDLDGPTEKARELHKRYHVEESVTYEAIDATKIPQKYADYFDVVSFKSVLGGIGRCSQELEKQVAISIYSSLKHGGICIFSENMQATGIHDFFRKKVKKRTWHYETDECIMQTFEQFRLINKSFYGFLGCFGTSEMTRNALGRMDSLAFDYIIPANRRYIGVYFFKKM